jgi:arginase family enzyme
LVTLGAVKAMKDVTVVSFDAHFDMRTISVQQALACVRDEEVA